MKSILLYILQKLWYLFVAIIIVMALAVTLARGLTPLLNQHKAKFEHWASRLLGEPVKVGRLSAWWEGFQPDIRFDDVQILNQKKTKTQLRINELQVNVSLLRSVMHRQLVPDKIVLIGANIVIHQKQDKSFQINGLQKQKIKVSSTGALDNTALVNWISSQKFLGIKNITVDYYPYQEKKIPILIDRLEILNSRKSHKFSGLVTLLQPQRTNIGFSAILKGDVHKYKQMKANVYLHLNNFQASTLTALPEFRGYKLKQGVLSGKFWLKWENQHVSSIQSLFAISNIKLGINNTKKPLFISKVSGNVLWQPRASGWQISGDQLNISMGNQVFLNNRFNLIVSQNNQGVQRQQFWINYLNLNKFKKLLLSGYFPIPQKTHKLLMSLNPSGELNNLYVSHLGGLNETKDFQVVSQFDNLAFNRWNDVPGIKGLSGNINISPANGEASINSKSVILDFGSLFSQKLLADVLSGQINWHQRDDKQWEVIVNKLTAMNQVVSLSGQASVLIPKEKKNITVSVLAGFDFNDSSQAHLYFPVGILKQDVVDWLNGAFVSGQGGKGTVILRGPIDHFPFDQHDGTFIISGNVRKTEFHFAPDWPNAKDVVAKLVFNGRSMTCKASSGSVYGLQVNYFNGWIPTMGGKTPDKLILKGSVSGDAGDIMKYLKNSPLKDSLGDVASNIDLGGKANVKLHINVPLKTPKKTTVEGHAKFNNALLKIPTWNISADKMNGKIFFTEKSLNSEGLSLNLFGQPTNVLIKTLKNKRGAPYTLISFQNRLSFAKLSSQFGWPKFSDVNGSFNAKAQVTLHTAKKDKRKDELQITSDLKGLAINMPAPLTKTSASSLPMRLDYWFGNASTLKLHLNLKNQFDGIFVLSRKNDQLSFQAGNVLFGKGVAMLSRNARGLYVNANLPTLDWQSWRDYFNQQISGQQNKKTANIISQFKQKLKTIKLRIGKIKLFQQQMRNATFQFKPRKRGWQVRVTSPKISGSFFLPNNYKKIGITGTFSRLYINSSKSLSSKKINPGSIPPLSLRINNFRYGRQNFGAINLKTSSSTNRLIIRSLKVNSPLVSGNILGSWQQFSSGAYRSSLTGSLKSNDISSLLKSLGFHQSLIVKKGTGTFNVNWSGPIYQWNVNRLNGNLAINFGSGRIVDLGKSANQSLNLGRLVTLLSIDRILHMDFSDFTQKGYSFESMKGHFLLKRGKIYTQDLLLDGSVADITIKGSFNLIKKTINLDLRVLPHAASSLPILAAVIINPLIGAAAWVASKLVSKEVGKLTGTQYKVTGSWSKPVVKKL